MNFLQPTATLAGATAALAVGVGFLPVAGGLAGMTPLVTGTAVSLLAVTGVFVQPGPGGPATTADCATVPGMSAGIGVAALGLLAAAGIPGIAGILVAAVLIGAGTGIATPVAFAHLAGTTPAERLGQTMGAAEIGRELGDAGGPLLVGAVAALLTLNWGLATLAAVLAVSVGAILVAQPRSPGKQRSRAG